jgi:uncharacterized phage protein (TIGR02218 family)
MTTAKVTQAGVEVLERVTPGVLVEQAGVEILQRVQPGLTVMQAGVEYLYKAVPCATQWTQVWIITRRDDEVFRFTALDRDLVWMGEIHKSCGSMNPSASESSDEVGGVGSMELAGILGEALAAGYVTEKDLYAGRFDGAYVEAWLVGWGMDDGTAPRRLLAGTFGKADFGETGWRMELLGDGALLQQTALLSTYGPGCRWKNGGGFGGPECGKDLGPLTVSGTVDTGGERAFIDAARVEAAGYFSRGRVSFTSGANEGLSAEIRTHAAGGTFTLWPRFAAPIAAGDTYDMTPGCTYMKDDDAGTQGCRTWGQITRYGGFDRTPGQDSLEEAPDAKQ